MNKTFKVTVEFICKDMIDEESLKDDFNGNAIAAYKMISDDFGDSIINFCDGQEKVVNVEVVDNAT